MIIFAYLRSAVTCRFLFAGLVKEENLLYDPMLLKPRNQGGFPGLEKILFRKGHA